MKFGSGVEHRPDEVDLQILELLQEDCRVSLGKIGEAVTLSAPAVLERIRKMEAAGIITGYRAVLDARRLGFGITAFIGVTLGDPSELEKFERQLTALPGVLECHHVTGEYTLLLKVKTADTSSLEQLIGQILSPDGVTRTETLVVLSTHSERSQLPLPLVAVATTKKRARHEAERPAGVGGADR